MRIPLLVRAMALLAGGLALASPASAQLVWEVEEPAPRSPSALVWEKDTPEEARLAEEAGAEEAGAGWAGATTSRTGTGAQGGEAAEGEAQEPPPLVGVPLEDPYPAPNLGGGQPSAYVANWGDYFISGSVGTPGNLRDGVVDGSLNMGFGMGDAYRLIAVEVDWNIGSTRNFNANGSFNVLVSRMLVSEPRLQVVVGGGALSLFSYGTEQAEVSTLYGVVTVALPLRTPNPYFNQVLQISAGVGGNSFASLDEEFEGPDTGFFAALGMEITSNVGLSMGISGRGTNVNLSYTPFRALPFTINLLAADVFGSSPFGTVGVLTVSWGDNFRTGLF